MFSNVSNSIKENDLNKNLMIKFTRISLINILYIDKLRRIKFLSLKTAIYKKHFRENTRIQ